VRSVPPTKTVTPNQSAKKTLVGVDEARAMGTDTAADREA
jgi:hypothetical protein